MEINRRCCVQCDNGGAGSRVDVQSFPDDPILWPQPDGTAGTIGADDLRALAEYTSRLSE